VRVSSVIAKSVVGNYSPDHVTHPGFVCTSGVAGCLSAPARRMHARLRTVRVELARWMVAPVHSCRVPDPARTTLTRRSDPVDRRSRSMLGEAQPAIITRGPVSSGGTSSKRFH
jgi:hypothetical protein